MQPVDRTDRLAAVVHHRAQRAQERLPGLAIRQRRVGAPYLGAVGRRVDSGRREPRPQRVGDVQHRPRRDHRQHQLHPGRRQHPQRQTQVGPQPTAADQHQPLAVVAMLIGELHGHTATERVTHHRRPGNAKFNEQITQRYRERAQRIVTARLGGFTMPQQVRRHHPVLLRQLGQHRPPGRRTARHAMDQQQRLAGSRLPIGNPVAVQIEKLHLAHANQPPSNGVPGCWHNVLADDSATYGSVGHRSAES